MAMILVFHSARRCLAERKTYTHSPSEVLVIESGFYYVQLREIVVYNVSHLEILALLSTSILYLTWSRKRTRFFISLQLEVASEQHENRLTKEYVAKRTIIMILSYVLVTIDEVWIDE
jgi:hypothetical protein